MEIKPTGTRNQEICAHTVRTGKWWETFGKMFRLVREESFYQIEAPCVSCPETLHPASRFYTICGIADLVCLYAAIILVMTVTHFGIPEAYAFPVALGVGILVPICYLLRLVFLSVLLLCVPWEKNVKSYANGTQEEVNRSAYDTAVVQSKYFLIAGLFLVVLLLSGS